MSGLPIGFGSPLSAPAWTVLSDGPAASRLRGSPSLSLALSGAFHLLLLGLFLAGQARHPGAESPGIEIRVWPLPNPELRTTEVRILDEGRSAPRQDDGGVITPRSKPRLDHDAPRIETPGIDGPVLPGERPGSPGETGGGGPAAPAAIVLDDVGGVEPSVYEEPPEVRYAPEPEYPPIARGAGIEGRVVIEVLVSREGTVRAVREREGNPILVEAASKALRTWRFRPALWNGKPVAAWVAIPVVFRLE
ncbi:MAG TPA: energy transducer TonB [Candidatus Eisenbacteria bacterium]|nr:energy transducer TonB [Candidatus Eisenbacteria bacterium]